MAEKDEKDPQDDGGEKDPSTAESEKTEDTGQRMVPQERLNETTKQIKELKTQLAAIEKEKASQLEKQLEEQGKFKELSEERAELIAKLQPKADEFDSISKTLQEYLDSQIADIPETTRDLVPLDLPVQKQLEWLSLNKTRLMKSDAPDLGAGKKGGTGVESVELTADERQIASDFGMSPEDYAKSKKDTDNIKE